MSKKPLYKASTPDALIQAITRALEAESWIVFVGRLNGEQPLLEMLTKEFPTDKFEETLDLIEELVQRERDRLERQEPDPDYAVLQGRKLSPPSSPSTLQVRSELRGSEGVFTRPAAKET